MTVDVIVPELGEVGMDVTFKQWLHDDGDVVVEGDPLFEVDTDKVTLEVQAYASGRLTDLMANPGDLIAPHQVVARIVEAEPPSSTGGSSEPG